ncbi:TPA: hypothetical protein ACGIK9_002891 [Acinetobacter baumannii]|uniref:hypothetical protein n=1 Tax=Acinetobacter baumannii TaxID=470 RepID=UPI00338D8E6D
MKVVYSPISKFRLSNFVIKYLKLIYKLNSKQAQLLSRNDTRLVEAVEKENSGFGIKLNIYQAQNLIRSNDTGFIRVMEAAADLPNGTLDTKKALTYLDKNRNILSQMTYSFNEQDFDLSTLVVIDVGEKPYYISTRANGKELIIVGTIVKDHPLSQLQLEALNLPKPVTLESADLSLSCVYDRSFGVFYVPVNEQELVIVTLLLLHFNKTASEMQKYIYIESDEDNISLINFYLSKIKGSFYTHGNGVICRFNKSRGQIEYAFSKRAMKDQ